MYSNLTVLDVHGHMSVPRSANLPLLYMMASNAPTYGAVVEVAQKGGTSLADFQKSAQRHVKMLDERKIDVQVIGPRPYLMLASMEDHLRAAWVRYVNDMIHQQVMFHPDRFAGACALPQISDAPDASHCLDELDRCVSELGFVAAYVSPDPAGRRTTPGLHEEYWFPLYAKAESLGVTLIVHGTNSLDRRYRVAPSPYQLGFVAEQYLATQALSHGDVFDRFPDLRVIVAHCGGALDRFLRSDPKLSQRDLSGNLFFDSCAYDEDFLTAAIKQRGVSNVCFGSEAPGAGVLVRPSTGAYADDLVPVIDSFDFLTVDDKCKIFHHNALRAIPRMRQLVP